MGCKICYWLARAWGPLWSTRSCSAAAENKTEKIHVLFLILDNMDSEHFSCDEEDFDTFSSVSSLRTEFHHDQHFSSYWENKHDDQDKSGIMGEDSGEVETSSQVARSIISGLFRRVAGKEVATAENNSELQNSEEHENNQLLNRSSRSMKLDFEGSDCSEREYHIGSPQQKLPSEVSMDNCNPDALTELESDPSPAGKLCEMSPAKENLNTLKLEGKVTASSGCGDNSSDIQDKISGIQASNSSFTARITDWINNVSLKEADRKEDSRSVSFQESIHCSTPVENVTMSDGSVFSEEDDQPAGYTAAVMSMDLVTPNKNTDLQQQQLGEKFQSEARTNISGSLVPTTAFTSYDQGFSNVQQSNGKELFDNGLIRHRLTGSYIRNIPFPCESTPRNYHIRVTETTEQKMRLNKDGSQVIDTTHTRQQSEKSFDKDQDRSWATFLKVFFILATTLLVISLLTFVVLQHFQIINVRGFSCLIEKNGVFEKFNSEKNNLIGV